MSDSKEQQFTIQPHPATSNEPPQLGAGLNNKPELSALNARGPHIPDQDKIRAAGEPLSRAELKARSEEINK